MEPAGQGAPDQLLGKEWTGRAQCSASSCVDLQPCRVHVIDGAASPEPHRALSQQPEAEGRGMSEAGGQAQRQMGGLSLPEVEGGRAGL